MKRSRSTTPPPEGDTPDAPLEVSCDYTSKVCMAVDMGDLFESPAFRGSKFEVKMEDSLDIERLTVFVKQLPHFLDLHEEGGSVIIRFKKQ